MNKLVFGVVLIKKIVIKYMWGDTFILGLKIIRPTTEQFLSHIYIGCHIIALSKRYNFVTLLYKSKNSKVIQWKFYQIENQMQSLKIANVFRNCTLKLNFHLIVL